MSFTSREQASSLGQEINLLFLKLIEAHAPYAEYRREFLKLEKRWLQLENTPARRLTVQQIIAKILLTEAYGGRLPWKEFGRWIGRLQQIGFRDLGMRVHVTCLYVQALHLFPQRALEAWTMLAEAERRVRYLRRLSPLREEYLGAIAHAKRVAQVPPPSR